MSRQPDSFVSNNDKSFILEALQAEQRIDGRRPYDFRTPQFQISDSGSTAMVQMGFTRTMAVVTAALESPYSDRQSEGSLRFNVEFSPMASPGFEPGRPGERAIELARLIERGLRDSRAIDLEALCVLAGRKVWMLRVDVHVLDHDGNLTDAASLAALAALMAFRRPYVEVGGGSSDQHQEVTVMAPDVREPLPLTIHHLPIAVTIALFQQGNLVCVDPSLKEEAAAAGSMTAILNTHGEVCAVQKAHGIGLSIHQVMRLMRIAQSKVTELAGLLQAALKAHEAAAVAARVRRQPTAPAAPAANKHIFTLGAADDIDAILAARAQQEAASAAALPEAEAAAARAAVLIKEDDDAAMEAGSSSDESSGDEIDVDDRIPTSSAPEATIKQEDESSMSHGMQASRSIPSAGAARSMPQGAHVLDSGQGPHDRGGQVGSSMGVHVKQEVSDPEEHATHRGLGVRAPSMAGAPDSRREKRSRSREGQRMTGRAPLKPEPPSDAFETIAAMIAGAGNDSSRQSPAALADAARKGSKAGRRRIDKK
ncbi:hypothetical protein WJX74_002852 [Apatococcus lobatus]|uniref:Uncharacterized protein n=1 Tax=Apatococcus lobatus TaxID=904363 RepID=A0AAW1SB11_9CHLO